MGRHFLLVGFTLTIIGMGCLVSVGPFAFGVGSNGRVGRALPSAPTPGGIYRNPQDGMELVFDGQKGLYRVPERPSLYYDEGVYYRRDAKRWVYSAHLDGPWRETQTSDLPMGLR